MGNFMKITPAAAVNILTYFADEIAKGVEPVFYIYRHDQKKMLKYQGKKLVREVPPGGLEWLEAILWPSSAGLFLNTETLKGYLLFPHVYGICCKHL
jgi:hypothetical protein